MHDIYYSPEEYGFEQIGQLDDPEACYGFDMLVVWRNKETGALVYATDSGCSCPSPFEDLKRAELIPITAEMWSEFQSDVEQHCLYDPDTIAADRTQLLAKVSALVP